jgi:spore coat protein U-like protein
MKRSVKFALATLIVALVATSSFAITVSSVNNNNVTATIAPQCKWITPLTLGPTAYDPFAVAATPIAPATINFKCVMKTNGTDNYKVWFDKTGGQMSGVATPANKMNYTLTDNAGVALPTVVGSAVTVAGVPGVAGLGYSYIVKGSIGASQDLPVDTYQDTVRANIEY